MCKQIYSFFLISTILMIPALVQAQIDLNSGGGVGIGTSPNSNNQLRVIASTEDIAIFGRSANTSNDFNYGVRGEAANGMQSYGVYGTATGAIVNYGVYGKASGPGTNWAGYFSGSVYTTGSYQSSDERLKKNIQNIDNTDVLTRILELRPVSYEFLTEDELIDQELPALNAKEGIHIGLLAQELEAQFPELVTDVEHVLNGDPTPSQTVTTKAINYSELTVALLAAVQKQQVELETLKAEIEELKTQLNEER